MALQQKLFSNIFLRNMLADFGFRSAYSTKKGGFTPYFQYIIGPYEQDYYLYFREEPFVKRYKNEIFNKLFEYDRNDISKYLIFHYDAYPDKQAFLKFLQDEIIERLEGRPTNLQKSKLQAALDWTTEKLQEHQTRQEQMLRQNIEQEVRTLLEKRQNGSANETSDQAKTFTENLIPIIEKLVQPYLAGSIKVAHPKYFERFIQHCYILRNLQYTDRSGKVKGYLFDSFSATDLAFICAFTFWNLWASNPILSKGRLQKQRKILTGTMKNLSVWKRHYGNFILNKPVIYLSLPFITLS